MKKYIYIILIALTAVSFGCSSETENANTAVNTAANAPATNAIMEDPLPDIDVNAPFVPGENPKNDLIGSTKRLQEHNAWSATLENNLFPEMKTELEYIKPDRYRIKNPVNEIVIIGGDGYVKNKNGNWERVSEDLGAQIEQMKRGLSAEGMKNIKEVNKAGTEKIDGKDALVYTYSIDMGATTPNNSTKVWIDKDTGLPLKIVVETQNAGEKQIVTRTYDYKKQVKIEAPKVTEKTEIPQK